MLDNSTLMSVGAIASGGAVLLYYYMYGTSGGGGAAPSGSNLACPYAVKGRDDPYKDYMKPSALASPVPTGYGVNVAEILHQRRPVNRSKLLVPPTIGGSQHTGRACPQYIARPNVRDTRMQLKGVNLYRGLKTSKHHDVGTGQDIGPIDDPHAPIAQQLNLDSRSLP